MRFRFVYLTVVSQALLTACGGGSSGSTAAPTPITPPTNNAPVFAGDYEFTFDENGTDPIGTVEATDSDGDAITYTVSGGSDADSISITESGELSFDAPPDFEAPVDTDENNLYEIVVTASDGQDSANAIVKVTVVDVDETPPNQSPVATPNAASISEDAEDPVEGNVITDNDGDGVDSDPDGDFLELIDVTGGDNYGELTTSSTGAYSYRLNRELPVVIALNDGESLTETYEYTISDGNNETASSTLTVTIQGVTNDTGGGEDPPIVIRVLSPQDNDLIADSLTVMTQITSNFELSAVDTNIANQSASLSYFDVFNNGVASCDNCFAGDINLSGVPSGSYVLAIEATDTRENAVSASVPVTLDRPPELIINSPIALSVARPSIEFDATCSDLEGDCEIRLSVAGVSLAQADNELLRTLELPTYDGELISMDVRVTDSAGQIVTETRQIYVETSPLLNLIAKTDGRILDFNDEALLYELGDSIFLRVEGGTVTELPLPEVSGIYRAFLTPRGFIVSWTTGSVLDAKLWELNDGTIYQLARPNSTQSLSVSGNYAVFNTDGVNPNQGRKLIRRNLLTTNNSVISEDSGNISNDVYADGSVAFWDKDYRVLTSDGTSSNVVASDAQRWATYPLIGDNRVLYRLHDPCCSNQQYSIRAIVDGNDTLLSDFRDQEVSPARDYRIEGQWIAYTDIGNAGQTHVWTYSPEGAKTKRTDFGSNSHIVAMSADGEVILSNQSAWYISTPSDLPEDLELNTGLIKKSGDTWLIAIGRELFSLGTSGQP